MLRGVLFRVRYTAVTARAKSTGRLSRVSVLLPSFHNRGDRAYRVTLTGLASLLPLLLVVVAAELAVRAWPSMQRFGFSFLWTGRWDPVAEVYGAGPLIFGTLMSSLVALLLAVPLALGVAIFLTEFAPKWMRQPVAFLVELLAAVPSVVYGVWGVFVLIPFLRAHAVPNRFNGHLDLEAGAFGIVRNSDGREGDQFLQYRGPCGRRRLAHLRS